MCKIKPGCGSDIAINVQTYGFTPVDGTGASGGAHGVASLTLFARGNSTPAFSPKYYSYCCGVLTRSLWLPSLAPL